MTLSKQKVELLAPAGDFEKLEIAIQYGANAVYLSDKTFSLRNFSGNFTLEDMQEAVVFAHRHGVQVYVACNVYARNQEQKSIERYLKSLNAVGPDALIFSDPGIFLSAREAVPDIPLHLSTQSNTTNYRAVQFWEKLGVKRINAARELSLQEIKGIAEHCKVEIEAFVHGAMCISYSGRCLLSSFLSQRDSNRGMCSHPCRWKYAVVEELRPGKYMPVAEDERGTYIFNSRDLCMIEHLPEMIRSGISSLKIEGRMKGIHYLAATVKVYREALDAFFDRPDEWKVKPEWIEQLACISHRGYCTGFYFGDPGQVSPNFGNEKPSVDRRFVAKVIGRNGRNRTRIQVRNKIFTADAVEVIRPRGPIMEDRLEKIYDEEGRAVPFAQPGSEALIEMAGVYDDMDLLRRVEST